MKSAPDLLCICLYLDWYLSRLGFQMSMLPTRPLCDKVPSYGRNQYIIKKSYLFVLSITITKIKLLLKLTLIFPLQSYTPYNPPTPHSLKTSGVLTQLSPIHEQSHKTDRAYHTIYSPFWRHFLFIADDYWVANPDGFISHL